MFDMIPEVRFKNFSNNYEDMSLLETIELLKDGTHGSHKAGDHAYLLSAKNIKNNKIIFSDSDRKIPLEDYNIIYKNYSLQNQDVLLTVVGTIGETALYQESSVNIAFQRSVAILRSNKNAIPMYLKTYLDTPYIQRQLKQSASMSAQAGVYLGDLAKLKVKIPSLDEQRKIGTLFNQLDDVITLQQKGVEQEQLYKRAMLQKMFPQKGERVPEVRFKEFNGEWKEKKIGELSEIRRGASPRPIQDPKWFDSDSDVGWLRISDVTAQQGRIHFLEQRISKRGQSKTLVLNDPHLILSIAATVGKPVINFVKTGVHDGFVVFINPKFDLEFMFQWLDFFRPQWQKYGQPGSQVNLNSELIRNQDIVIPCIEEQQKIGTFFKQIDIKIEQHQQKLENYQKLKRALLKKMFV